MRIEEDATITTLTEQKETFKSAYREEWQDAYIRWIHRRIAEKVSDTLDFIDSLAHHSPSSWDEDTLENIHSRRRIIAGYLQEAELCCFSVEIYGQVERDKMYILKGAWYVVRSLVPSIDTEAATSVSTYCSLNEHIIFDPCIRRRRSCPGPMHTAIVSVLSTPRIHRTFPQRNLSQDLQGFGTDFSFILIILLLSLFCGSQCIVSDGTPMWRNPRHPCLRRITIIFQQLTRLQQLFLRPCTRSRVP